MTSTWTRDTLSADVVEELKGEIAGKTVLVTGTTIGGLGFQAAHDIAKYAKTLIIVGRSLSKLQASEDAIHADYADVKIHKVVTDLTSFASVRAGAAEINALGEPIHVIIANATVAPDTYALSIDGHELQFAGSHLGHFLLIKNIFPLVLAARPSSPEGFTPRVVVVSSHVHIYSPIRFDDLNFEGGKAYTLMGGYAHAKTANILFASELGRKAASKGVLAYSLYPGSIWTNAYDNFTPENKIAIGLANPDGTIKEAISNNQKAMNAGATTHIVAAFDPRIKDQSGGYLYDDGQVRNDKVAEHAADPANAKRLWELSERLVGEKFDV